MSERYNFIITASATGPYTNFEPSLEFYILGYLRSFQPKKIATIEKNPVNTAGMPVLGKDSVFPLALRADAEAIGEGETRAKVCGVAIGVATGLNVGAGVGGS